MTGFFEDHLNLDSVVAFVDGELSLVAYQRAAAHIGCCARCAAEVGEQRFARDALRSAAAPSMPGSLAASLFSIPIAAPMVSRTPGVRVDARTGHAIRISHVGREMTRSRRLRFGAGALVAGFAVGAFATAGPSEPITTPDPISVEPASFSPAPVIHPPALTDATRANPVGTADPTTPAR